MELNYKQEIGRKLAIQWWNNERNIRPFVITGYAGTGKSTLINFIIESLDLIKDEISFLTFTGKAASVLINKGLPAQTIHSFIYIPIEDKKRPGHFIFIKRDKEDIIVEGKKLIIIDEISMVSEEIFLDVLSYNIPCIVLGDPFQLRPVMGTMAKIIDFPDIMLTEVMRQNLENPILYLATKARNKELIMPGIYGENCVVIERRELNEDHFLKVDQIIAGKNKTVANINEKCRKILGYEEILPEDGDKVICLKNNWDECIPVNKNIQPLVNGLIGTAKNTIKFNDTLLLFKFDFNLSESDSYFKNITADEVFFIENIVRKDEEYYEKHRSLIKKRKRYEDNNLDKVNEFTYGYCITTHKSQGSEFDYVTYIHEYMKDINYNLMYTGITRAKEGLVLVI